jgi:hypothetical protein
MILHKKLNKNKRKVEAHKKQNKVIKITQIPKLKIKIRFYNNTWHFVTVQAKKILTLIQIFSIRVIK